MDNNKLLDILELLEQLLGNECIFAMKIQHCKWSLNSPKNQEEFLKFLQEQKNELKTMQI